MSSLRGKQCGLVWAMSVVVIIAGILAVISLVIVLVQVSGDDQKQCSCDDRGEASTVDT